MAAGADSVCVCLSKGLGAPVGSLLLGHAAFVAQARRMRKVLGGGMRQAGVFAAAGLVALDGWRERLADDHRRARALAQRLAELPGLHVEPDAVVTNIVFCDVQATGVPPAALVERLLACGVACSATPTSLRFVLHHQIGDAEVDLLARALAEIVTAEVAA